MKVTKEDLNNYKMFKSVVTKSKIEIQGSAVKTVGHLFTWFDELEKRIEDSISKNAKPKRVDKRVD